MSMPGFSVTSGGNFAVTTTNQVILKLLAGATNPPIITEFGISFDGVTSGATPILVEMCASTEATAGTAGSIGTVTQIRGYPAFTPISTASGQYTNANLGTAYTPYKQWWVPAYQGILVVQFPLGRESKGQISATTAMKAIVFRISSTSATPNARAYIEWDE